MDAAYLGNFETQMSYTTGLTTYDWAYLRGQTIYFTDSENEWFREFYNLPVGYPKYYDQDMNTYRYLYCIDKEFQ